MGTVARSAMFQSDLTEPYGTVLIKTGGQDCPLRSMMCDEANIRPCHMLSITATTYRTEMKMTATLIGQTALGPLGNDLWICEFDFGTPAIAYDGTQVDNLYADLDSIKVYEMKTNMEVWAIGSTLTAAEGEILITANTGILTNVGDPDGTAIDESARGFMALTALSAGTYIPVRDIGHFAHDKSA
jgi:hypothetical protein